MEISIGAVVVSMVPVDGATVGWLLNVAESIVMLMMLVLGDKLVSILLVAGSAVVRIELVVGTIVVFIVCYRRSCCSLNSIRGMNSKLSQELL